MVRNFAGILYSPRKRTNCAKVNLSLRPVWRTDSVSRHTSSAPHGESTTPNKQIGEQGGGRVRSLQNLWNVLYGKWALIAIAGFLIGLFSAYSVSELPIEKQPTLPSMSECTTATLNLFGPKNPPNAEMLRDAREHCYSLIQGQGLLSDFAVRKLNFFQQYRANGVLMWMVVAVTFSGVLLAGFQLWASYQLAIANKSSLDVSDSELILKRDQLSLKSTTIGLLILLISFCFFLVFVLYVYRFETVGDHANSASLRVPTLPMDGLGPPPPTQGKP
jgi:hypothetical protein